MYRGKSGDSGGKEFVVGDNSLSNRDNSPDEAGDFGYEQLKFPINVFDLISDSAAVKQFNTAPSMNDLTNTQLTNSTPFG